MPLKVSTYFLCQACGYKTTKWLGKCPDCSEWNSLTEEQNNHSAGLHNVCVPDNIEQPIPITDISGSEKNRISSTIPELDRVLGGGIVPGSVVLIGGDPGIGKSTLLLQSSGRISLTGRTVLYITGEESSHQVRIRGDRLGIASRHLLILPENNLESAIAQIEKLNPSFVIIDSIQTIYTIQLQSAPGTISQIRETSAKLAYLAKKLNIPLFLVGHVTKDGAIAGPRVLEHMVDTVLYFEGDSGHSFRILRSVKNRFGSTNEIGIFEMKRDGLEEVVNPSELFISGRPSGVSGSVVVSIMEGTRPILIELQALVSKSASLGMPKRMSTGVDYNRVSLLLAVLEKKIHFSLHGEDVFVNVAGGVKTDEPAADLGIVTAIYSSYKDQPADPYTVVIGEVGLSGEVRSVTALESRICEAARLGFKRCIVPRNKKGIGGDYNIELVEICSIEEVITHVMV